MAIGMGGGRGFGIEAKVEAAMDRGAEKQLTKDVEQAIERAEGSVSPGIEGRTGGLASGRRMGGATALGATGLLSKTGGAASMLGTVALGGVLATGILTAVSSASGHMKATRSILGTAMSLFFKPFGDFLGKLLRPAAKAMLDFALYFNDTVGPPLLSAASFITGEMGTRLKSMRDFLNDIADVFGSASNVLANWFGPFPGWSGGVIDNFPGWVGGVIDKFPGWAGVIIDDLDWRAFVPGLAWTAYIDDIAWAGFVSGVELTNFVMGTDLDEHVVAADLREFVTSVDLSTFVDAFPGWPDVGSLWNSIGGWPDVGSLWNSIGGWPDVENLWDRIGGWPDVGSLWNSIGGWPNVSGLWNSMGGWPDISLPDDFWPDLGSFSSIVGNANDALGDFIGWLNNFPGVDIPTGPGDGNDPPPDPCAGVNCGAGKTCIEGRCVDTGGGGGDECTSTNDCPPDEVCRFGVCVPKEAGGMARGGVVSSPTNAVVGESGAEAVLPLDELDRRLTDAFRKALADAASIGGGGGGGGTPDRIDVRLMTSKRRLGETSRDEQNLKLDRTTTT